MASNINRVIITGNLTKDPDLKTLDSGFAICSLRIATNTRKKEGDNWVDKPNYFDVTIFGGQGENVAKYLSKGSGVAIDGRLEWSEWEDKDGNKRQSTKIIADNVQFLSSGKSGADSSAPATAAGDDASDDLPF